LRYPRAYGAVMLWELALWGLGGGAVNRALIYLEAAQRVKRAPWRRPDGPGGGLYITAQILHCAIAAVVTGAVAQAGYVPNAVVALAIGAAAPTVVKKLSGYTLAVLPRTSDDESQDEPDDS
jgi:hypothetical protein